MKKIISVLMTFLLLCCTAFVGVVPAQATASAYAVGDTIYFGSYPQSQVTDSSLISALNNINSEWISYGYYSQNTPSDYMKYRDVSYSGNKYRGVLLTKKRPADPSKQATVSGNISQYGFDINTVYWFKFEPLRWRILDPQSGLIWCDKAIDSQQFYYSMEDRANDTYPNEYEVSEIRRFINTSFYNTAFSPCEKDDILDSVIDVEHQLIADDYNFIFKTYSKEITEKVFLPSYEEVSNPDYGIITPADRICRYTDYALSQGLAYAVENPEDTDGFTRAWLRSCGNNKREAKFISYDGTISSLVTIPTYIGVRPALRLNLNADRGCNYVLTSHVPVTCTETGTDIYTCTQCGASKSVDESPLGHNYILIDTIPAACTEFGVETYACSRCTDMYQQILQQKAHHFIGDYCRDCDASLFPEKYDFNNDHYAGAADLVQLRRVLLRVETLSYKYDLNYDAAVNVLDLIRLKKVLASASEKTYTVYVYDVHDQKQAVTTALKNELNLSLKDAKNLLNEIPAAVKSNATYSAAQSLCAAITNAGGEVRVFETGKTPRLYDVVLINDNGNGLAIARLLCNDLGVAGSPTDALNILNQMPYVVLSDQWFAKAQDTLKLLNDAGATAVKVLAGTAKYDVVITGIASEQRMAVINAIRDLTGCGLSAAKNLADNLPSVVESNVAYSIAQSALTVLQNAGATAEIRLCDN